MLLVRLSVTMLKIVTEWQMTKLTEWPIDQLTIDQMAKWPNGRMTKWPNDQKNKLPIDWMTGSFADDWPYGIFYNVISDILQAPVYMLQVFIVHWLLAAGPSSDHGSPLSDSHSMVAVPLSLFVQITTNIPSSHSLSLELEKCCIHIS